MYLFLLILFLSISVILVVVFISIKRNSILTSQYKVMPVVEEGKMQILIDDPVCKRESFLIDAAYYHNFDDHPMIEIDYKTSLISRKGRIYKIKLFDKELI